MAKARSLSDIVEECVAEGKVELPVFDRTANRMQEMVAKEEYDIGAIEQLVTNEPALCGSLLRYANSSFFGGIEKVVTVREAITRLGVKQVVDLVILSSQRGQYKLRDPYLRSVAHELWQHAVCCAIGGGWLAGRLFMRERASEAFLAGLLHDIGKLLILRVLDDLVEQGRIDFKLSNELILQLVDGMHTAHGHELMQSWNIPDIYAEVVRRHHEDECDENDILLNLIRLVDMACNRLGIGTRGVVDSNLAACQEAHNLSASEIVLAELEVQLEDALAMSK